MKKVKLLAVMIIICINLVGCNNSGVSNPSELNPGAINNETVETNKITIDQAKEIALKHAELTEDQVSFVKTESEFDDGIEKYNIEFYYNNKEYDYEINVANGEIIKYDLEDKVDENNNQNNSNIAAKISEEQAKEIALEHANLTSDQVTFAKAKLDSDNGIQKYEVEFYYNNKEYNYEIDANTSEILAYEQK